MIRARNLGKAYRLYKGSLDALIEWLDPRQVPRHSKHWALREISFDVDPGDGIGLVGWNGAGKTTLLRILCGITAPTEGTVSVQGRMGLLFSPVAGMSQDLSARRNVFLHAGLIGLDRTAVKERLDLVAREVGLEQWLDRPLRSFSVGMRSRLAFALTSLIEADIYFVDEGFSGGDPTFRKRAAATLARRREAGKAVLMATHRMELVAEVCNRALWLHEGRVRALGSVQEVVPEYLEFSERAASRGEALAVGIAGPGPDEFPDPRADGGRSPCADPANAGFLDYGARRQ